MTAAVMIAGLSMSACGGGVGGEGEPSTPPSETKTPSSSATSEPSVPGERVTLSVASVVQPEGLEFRERKIDDSPEIEYRKWFTTYPGTDEPSCVISLSVQSEVGDNAARVQLEEARTMRKKNLKSSGMDPNAPEDVVGTVLKYDGTWDTEDGPRKASSIARVWQTRGNTLISLAVNANDDGPKGCNPEEIASTLRWNGEERPMGGDA